MLEIDTNRDGKLDIDEFMALMTHGEEDFQSQGARNTLITIRRSRRINPIEFVKAFKHLPVNFVDSFTKELFLSRKNTPSSAFMPRIDPKTLLYTDILPPPVQPTTSTRSGS